MKKVMVTKGLRGRPDPEAYHEKCMVAVNAYYDAKGEKYMILSSGGVRNDFDGSTINKRLYALGHTIQQELALADEVVFMDDWERFDGPVVEHLMCIRYGIPCVYLTS